MLVVAGEGWHRGVIGIVASKLVDPLYRPAIVLSVEGDSRTDPVGASPGSTCSRAWSRAPPLCCGLAATRPAAGLQLEAARIKEFRIAVYAHAEPSAPTTYARACGSTARSPSAASRPVMPDRAPGTFWAGNQGHCSTPARLDCRRSAAVKDRHLKMSMKQNGRVLRAIQWNAAEHNNQLAGLKEGVEIAYTVEENKYPRGRNTLN